MSDQNVFTIYGKSTRNWHQFTWDGETIKLEIGPQLVDCDLEESVSRLICGLANLPSMLRWISEERLVRLIQGNVTIDDEESFESQIERIPEDYHEDAKHAWRSAQKDFCVRERVTK